MNRHNHSTYNDFYSEVKKLGIYVGIKEKTKPEIFEAETTPTKESHPQYDFTVGPFRTVEDAKRYVGATGQGVACSEG